MYEYAATIIRVVDGDTLDVILDLGFDIAVRHTLRLDGIDAPESRTAAGKLAKDHLQMLIAGGIKAVVSTRKDRQEKYGRYLAVVRMLGATATLNDAMVAAGHATPYSGGRRAA